MPSLYDVKRAELATLLDGEPSYRVDQIWQALYEQGRAPDDITTIPRALRHRLAETLPPALRPEAAREADSGATRKYLWALADGARIETVLMRYPDRATVCVSSQAGCAMGCGFCATGQAGFERHLTVGEILEQVIRARRDAERRVSNVVFMGMGEPLANFDPVWEATERLLDDVGLSARHITISTVGLVPGIRRLTATGRPVGLAVSLHAANDELRNQLVPINERYPIDEVLAACRDDVRARGRRLSFEWAMIADVNDRAKDADELAALARPLGAHVNLIPLNPTPGWPSTGSSPGRVRAFRDHLADRGVNATIRDNRGTAIDAACGQLAAGGATQVSRREG